MSGKKISNPESTAGMTLRHKSSLPNPAVIAPALLDWFAKNARDLPWRRTRDPYAVWVSEIMLQQTQVNTVIPYWERWMRELPDVESLAKVKPERIHKLWEGLGYYTRVRNMHRAAVQMMERHGGKFPRRFEDVMDLPGIGRYTAGAISSIAFNEARPIVDGNVVRVLTRLFGIDGDPRGKETNAELWRIAETLVNAASGHCSELNQSLMELGALVCTPRRPKCAICPVRKVCTAFRAGIVDELPNLAPRVASTSRRFAAFVIEYHGRFLVRQRPAAVVNAQLWEFPNSEITNDSSNIGKVARKEAGVAVNGFKQVCAIKHSITRYSLTLNVYAASLKGNPARLKKLNGSRWCTIPQMKRLAFASAHGKILKSLRTPS